jgi:hypothetical protein
MLLTLLLALLASDQARNSVVVGDYYQGDGTGVNWYLTLKSDSQYSFKWAGCLGEYAKSEGQWSMAGTQIELHPGITVDMPERFPTAYEIVRWGERTYLVPSDELTDFCNLINQKLEPRNDAHGMVFLKDGDWNRKATGKPGVPAPFISFLLAKPVRAIIVSSDGSRGTIDAGRRDGLRVGMVLTLQDLSVHQVRVTELSENFASVESVGGESLSLTPVSTLLFDESIQQ